MPCQYEMTCHHLCEAQFPLGHADVEVHALLAALLLAVPVGQRHLHLVGAEVSLP